MIVNEKIKVFKELEVFIREKADLIAKWCESEVHGMLPPIYSSYDIRLSSFKTSVVDCNMFPGGFNNFTDEKLNIAAKQLNTYIANTELKFKREIKKVLLVPEEFERNEFYFKNVNSIIKVLRAAGLEVYCQCTDPELVDCAIDIRSKDRPNNLGDLDLVLLNLDLTDGLPDFLHQFITSKDVVILPNPDLGWHKRSKAGYFSHYKDMTSKFAHDFGVDSWLLSAITTKRLSVDFESGDGVATLSNEVEKLLDKIAEKYTLYGISENPCVFMKVDNGTFGMGVITISSKDQVLHMNKKMRKKMIGARGGGNGYVLLQEGVPTARHYNEVPAEYTAYVIGSNDCFGSFIRYHIDKNDSESLNSPGSLIEKNHHDLSHTEWLACKLGVIAATFEASKL